MDPTLIIIVVLGIGLMYFMTSRQRKAQKAQQAFRSELAPGQEIMTASGLFGTIVDVDEDNDRITIESAGSRSVWLRAAIAKRVDASTPAPPETPLIGLDRGDGNAPIGGGANLDIPDDISGLDTAQREYREQQSKDTDDK